MREFRFKYCGLIALLILLTTGIVAYAQFRGRRSMTNQRVSETWQNNPEFKHDVFTFVRIRYSSSSRGWGRGGGRWTTDAPDAEQNLSFRLQQMTSLKVEPDVPKVLDLTDPDLFNYPFIYIVEPGEITLSVDEVKALRRYLLNGGFLMVDDFWGTQQWNNFYREIKRVFPEREPEELPIEHPIFHCVFDLKEKPQIPAIQAAMRGRADGITWEYHDDEECKDVHYKGIFDDKRRLMAIICHNTDLGDGWEREGEDEWYFREFSEKKGYPMGINIIFYAMTH